MNEKDIERMLIKLSGLLKSGEAKTILSEEEYTAVNMFFGSKRHSLDEISEITGKSKDEILQLQGIAFRNLGLIRITFETIYSELLEHVPPRDVLTIEERAILKYRFTHGMTTKEIANYLNMDRRKVADIKWRGFFKINEYYKIGLLIY